VTCEADHWGEGAVRRGLIARMLQTALRALDSRFEIVRVFGLSVLSYLGRDAAPPDTLLRLAVDDKSGWVRGMAIPMLAETERPIDVERLCRALDDSWIVVATLCAQALSRVGDWRAVPHLTRALSRETKDAPQFVSQEAPVALLRGSARPALNEERQSFVRALVAALEKLGDPRALPALLGALQIADAQVQYDVLRTLYKIRTASPQSHLGSKEELARAIGPLRSFGKSSREAMAFLDEIEARPEIRLPVPAEEPRPDAGRLPRVDEGGGS
jgi:HEAT repeat protein